jgi:hypothetical protein
MLLFDPEYLGKLIELGDADAERRGAELHRFLTGTPERLVAAGGD